MERIGRILVAMLVLCLAYEAAKSFASDDWFVDLTYHYRWLRFGGELGLAILALACKSRRLAVFAFALSVCLLAVVHGLDIARLSFAYGKAKLSSVHVRVISFNVLTSNSRHEDVLKWIGEQIRSPEPTVIFLMELNDSWLKDLQPLKSKLPNAFELPRKDNFGLAVFTNSKIAKVSVTQFDDLVLPAIDADLLIGEKQIKLFGVHTYPPATERGFTARNQYLANLRKRLDSLNGPILIVGDLNCSPWSPHIGTVLSAQGQGPVLEASDQKIFRSPTWLGLGWVFGVPIDYILHSKEFQVASFQTGPDLGSDHRPIVADLVL